MKLSYFVECNQKTYGNTFWGGTELNEVEIVSKGCYGQRFEYRFLRVDDVDVAVSQGTCKLNTESFAYLLTDYRFRYIVFIAESLLATGVEPKRLYRFMPGWSLV